MADIKSQAAAAAPAAAMAASLDMEQVVLSAGAAQALSAVAGRVLRAGSKRPRTARGVLAAAPEVAEEQAKQAAANAEEKQRRKARKRFDEMARVIPDAATDANREKQLRATATRGAVALFNAVARAQRGNDNPVQRDKFMHMLKNNSGGAAASAGASWLKDDFLTSKARKQKNFDNVQVEEEEEESELDSEEGEEVHENEHEMESEPEIESEVELEDDSE